MSIAVERHVSLASLFASMKEATPPFFLLAGGTDLMVLAKDGVLPEAATWFDISDIPSLKGIVVDGDELVIGGGVTHSELAASPLIQSYAPALAQAAINVGSTQIRNRGTLAGNIANGSPAADTVPALFSLSAVVKLRSVRGLRAVKIEDYALAPRRTVRAQDELIESVSIPVRAGMRGSWLALAQRNALAISKISVAVSAVVQDEKFAYLRIAFGSVGPTVLRAPKAEAALMEHGLTATGIALACRVAQDEVKPISDIRSSAEYRRAMSGVILGDALEAIKA